MTPIAKSADPEYSESALTTTASQDDQPHRTAAHLTAADCRHLADEALQEAADARHRGDDRLAAAREETADALDHLAELRDLGNDYTTFDQALAALRRGRIRERIYDQPSLGAHREGVFLTRADRIPAEHVEYLDDPWIPLRVVTLVVGVDGVGKSTVLYERAARASRGQLPGAQAGRPIDVVIASSEDHPGSVIVPRLVAAGAELARVHIVRVRRDGLTGDIALPDDLDALAGAVQRVAAGLLIVDPLVAHMPMSVDSHKAQHVRSVLAPLARLAEEARLAVCAVVHFNGAPTADVRSRISGSKALRDASRSVLVCGADPKDDGRYVVVQDKNSFGPRPTTGRAYEIEPCDIEHQGTSFTTSRVVWLGDVDVDSRGLLAGPEPAEERSERDEAIDFLRLALADGPRPAADIKKEFKTEYASSERTLARARRDLGVIVERIGFPSTTTWRLPVVPHPNGTTDIGPPWHDCESQAEQANQGSSPPDSRQSCPPPEAGTTGPSSPLGNPEPGEGADLGEDR